MNIINSPYLLTNLELAEITDHHNISFYRLFSTFFSRVDLLLQAVDLSKPIDKRIYKGTQPTCHDFNQYSATAESVALIVGFSAGQVQYLDPIKKETSKLFNEEVFSSHSVCIKAQYNFYFYLYFPILPIFFLLVLFCLLVPPSRSSLFTHPSILPSSHTPRG